MRVWACKSGQCGAVLVIGGIDKMNFDRVAARNIQELEMSLSANEAKKIK